MHRARSNLQFCRVTELPFIAFTAVLEQLLVVSISYDEI